MCWESTQTESEWYQNGIPGEITDLYHLESVSVNNVDLHLLRYTSVEADRKAAKTLGAGTLLAKPDIKSAYNACHVCKHTPTTSTCTK